MEKQIGTLVLELEMMRRGAQCQESETLRARKQTYGLKLYDELRSVSQSVARLQPARPTSSGESIGWEEGRKEERRSGEWRK